MPLVRLHFWRWDLPTGLVEDVHHQVQQVAEGVTTGVDADLVISPMKLRLPVEPRGPFHITKRVFDMPRVPMGQQKTS